MVTRDLLDAASILRTQLRFARNLAAYLVAKHGNHGSLPNILEPLGRLETRISEHVENPAKGWHAILEREWSRQPEATYTKLLGAMSEAQAELKRTLEAAAPSLRAARQAMYGKGPEYPQPSLFFGLDQQKMHDRASKVAKAYAQETSKLVGKLLKKAGSVPCVVTVAFEYIPSPVQRNLHHPAGNWSKDSPAFDVFVSAPVWHLTMPRYLPVLCHEIAHPFVQLMLQDRTRIDFDADIINFCNDAYEIVSAHLGKGVPFTLDDQVATMAREVLTDLLAITVAGPAYAIAWLAATFGHTPLTTTYRPTLPTYVRLKVLVATLAKIERVSPLVRQLLEQDCKLYEEAARATGLKHKMNYQSALEKACVRLAEKAWDEFRIEDHLRESSAMDADWEDQVRAACKLVRRSAPVRDDELDPARIWWRRPVVSVPALLWEIHLRVDADSESPEEGRLFHQIEGEVLKSDLVQGPYWEWLGIKRYYGEKGLLNDEEFIEECRVGQQDLTVMPALGPYNIVSMRRNFVAKRFYNYPPAIRDGRGPHHASRQIIVEVFRRDHDDDAKRADHLLTDWPIVMVSEVTLRERTPQCLGQVVRDLYGDERGSRLLAFMSLASSDLVVFMPVATLKELEEASNLIAETDGIERSMSHLLMIDKPARGQESSAFSVRSFLRLKGPLNESRSIVTGLLEAESRNAKHEKVFGPDDIEIEWTLKDAADFTDIMDCLHHITGRGCVGNVDSRLAWLDDKGGKT